MMNDFILVKRRARSLARTLVHRSAGSDRSDRSSDQNYRRQLRVNRNATENDVERKKCGRNKRDKESAKRNEGVKSM